MKQRKEFQKLLSDRKLKKTSQRALIWDLLAKSKGHPSVEELRAQLLARGHRVGLATIYRTIKIMLDSGLIRQSRIAGVTRYEPLVNQPNHLHFVCNVCSRTTEFPSPQIEALIHQLTREQDFEPRFSRYTIFGLCKTCAKKQEKAAGVNEKTRQEKTAARDALELTLAIERLGYSFYMSASKKTQDDRGRIMFRRLAAEESGHLQRLREAYRALLDEHAWLRREPARLPVSRKIARDLFPQKTLLRLQVTDKTSDIEALEMAMELERRSHQFFKDFAHRMDDSTGRKAFLEFAADEKSHLESLITEYENLTSDRRSV
ncbi:MAG TPA: transcriptional repressor [Terriglobia bacterium]|nr:transcriptional repressor [Terriglobia bacterium]